MTLNINLILALAKLQCQMHYEIGSQMSSLSGRADGLMYSWRNRVQPPSGRNTEAVAGNVPCNGLSAARKRISQCTLRYEPPVAAGATRADDR